MHGVRAPLIFSVVGAALLAAAGWGEEASSPSAADLLRASIRTYRSARTLTVKARTEIPVPPGQPKVLLLHRWVDNRLAGTLQSGTWVDEREYRVIRGVAFRLRGAEYGMSGSCRLHLPSGSFERLYWVGQDNLPDFLRRRGEGIVRFADGKLALGDRAHLSPALNLPLQFFGSTQPDSYFDLEGAHYQSEPGAQDLNAWLVVKAKHTLLRDEFGEFRRQLKGKYRFGEATWKITINRDEHTIQQVEVHELWPGGRAGEPDRVLDLTEAYSDQVINAPLKLEEFILEPPDPVKPPKTRVPEKSPEGGKETPLRAVGDREAGPHSAELSPVRSPASPARK